MRISPVLVRRLAVSMLVAGLLAAWQARPGPDRKVITVEFARAGLNVRPGDEVRVRGVPVGRISAIDIDDDAFIARYRLSVDSDAPIAADTTASLVPKTLFGDKYVELEAAPSTGERIADGTLIPLARTSAPSEVQEVLDRLQPILEEVDPVTFANVIASTAEGLDGAGADIATLVDAVPSALETIIANEKDLGRIFRAIPGVAGTLEARADQLVQVADAFGTLAQTVDDNEDELLAFVTDTAELSSRAAELLTTEGARLDRITEDGFSVVDLVAEQPEAVRTLLKSTPAFVNGLAAATKEGYFKAPIASFGVLIPTVDAKGPLGEAGGGAGFGPDIVVEGFPIEDGITVGSPDGGGTGATTGTVNGVIGLLNNLLGGDTR
ncbi:MAG TPA: MlaD family protein [Acidimicrobiales bacterium]|nr:MlaD family protein [Acidimicrobiales bacterium]